MGIFDFIGGVASGVKDAVLPGGNDIAQFLFDTEDSPGDLTLHSTINNLGSGAKEMATGLAGLGQAAAGDVNRFFSSAFNGMDDGITPGPMGFTGPTDDIEYQSDDVVKALPQAMAQDYANRYGPFLKGDFTGLAERPLDFGLDALGVYGAAKGAGVAGKAYTAAGQKVAAMNPDIAARVASTVGRINPNLSAQALLGAGTEMSMAKLGELMTSATLPLGRKGKDVTVNGLDEYIQRLFSKGKPGVSFQDNDLPSAIRLTAEGNALRGQVPFFQQRPLRPHHNQGKGRVIKDPDRDYLEMAFERQQELMPSELRDLDPLYLTPGTDEYRAYWDWILSERPEALQQQASMRALHSRLQDESTFIPASTEGMIRGFQPTHLDAPADNVGAAAFLSPWDAESRIAMWNEVAPQDTNIMNVLDIPKGHLMSVGDPSRPQLNVLAPGNLRTPVNGRPSLKGLLSEARSGGRFGMGDKNLRRLREIEGGGGNMEMKEWELDALDKGPLGHAVGMAAPQGIHIPGPAMHNNPAISPSLDSWDMSEGLGSFQEPSGPYGEMDINQLLAALGGGGWEPPVFSDRFQRYPVGGGWGNQGILGAKAIADDLVRQVNPDGDMPRESVLESIQDYLQEARAAGRVQAHEAELVEETARNLIYTQARGNDANAHLQPNTGETQHIPDEGHGSDLLRTGNISPQEMALRMKYMGGPYAVPRDIVDLVNNHAVDIKELKDVGGVMGGKYRITLDDGRRFFYKVGQDWGNYDHVGAASAELMSEIGEIARPGLATPLRMANQEDFVHPFLRDPLQGQFDDMGMASKHEATIQPWLEGAQDLEAFFKNGGVITPEILNQLLATTPANALAGQWDTQVGNYVVRYVGEGNGPDGASYAVFPIDQDIAFNTDAVMQGGMNNPTLKQMAEVASGQISGEEAWKGLTPRLRGSMIAERGNDDRVFRLNKNQTDMYGLEPDKPGDPRRRFNLDAIDPDDINPQVVYDAAENIQAAQPILEDLANSIFDRATLSHTSRETARDFVVPRVSERAKYLPEFMEKLFKGRPDIIGDVFRERGAADIGSILAGLVASGGGLGVLKMLFGEDEE